MVLVAGHARLRIGAAGFHPSLRCQLAPVALLIAGLRVPRLVAVILLVLIRLEDLLVQLVDDLS